MTLAERLLAWNRSYDKLPSEWRFQLVIWSLLALGAINLMLTIWSGFPFALLVLLGIIFIAAVRVPYAFGWKAAPDHAVAGDAPSTSLRIDGPGWLLDLNRRYDALPEARRFWIFPAVLVIAGAINMALTIGGGFPFGLLFLLTLLVLVAIRAPYTAGWFKPNPAPGAGIGTAQPQAAEIEHARIQAISSSEPMPPATLRPPGTEHAEIDRAPDAGRQE